MTCSRREDGSAAVEVVLITPILIALLILMVMLGRIEAARATVDAAARNAARAASLTADPTSAATAGADAADASTRTAGLHCQPLTTTITTDSGLGGSVVANVSCTVALGDLATGLHLPATRTITARFAAPIDQYRSDP